MAKPKKYIQNISLFSLGIALFLITGTMTHATKETYAYPTEKLAVITKKGNVICFDVEIALSNEQKTKGLMFRTNLKPKNGMLFYWNTPLQISMWMKNTPIPLDMLFASKDGTITFIEPNTEPLSTTPITAPGTNHAILEINAGTAQKHDITPGDQIIHPLFSQSDKKTPHICS